jgi:hypothetical protein
MGRRISDKNDRDPLRVISYNHPMISLADAHPLWLALRDFSWNDSGVSLGFADRLQRDHGWNKSHTTRVLQEYRRFLFLAVVAGHKVTPSVDVDEAWHLHLVYTESYWNDLCRDTLKRPLHHGPTKGGHCENKKFEDSYQKTLESYTHWFGVNPPEDIWPEPEQRFSRRGQYRSIRQGDYFLVPTKWNKLPSLTAVVAVFAGGMTLQAFNNDSSPWLIFGFLGFILLVTLLTRYMGSRQRRRRGKKRNEDSGCAPFGGTGCSSSTNKSADSGCSNSGCSGAGCGGGGCGGGGGD